MNKKYFIQLVNFYFKDNNEIKEQIIKNFDKYQNYANLVAKWNSKINITGFNKDKFIFNGIIEPLLITKVFKKIQSPIVDIGTGAGIPSVSLAIFFDKIKVYAVEINKKKLSFLNFIKFNLNLDNLYITKEIPKNAYLITSRAFMQYNNFFKFIHKEKLNCQYYLLYVKDKLPDLKIHMYIKYKRPKDKITYFQVIGKSN